MVPFIWLGGFHAVAVRACTVLAALTTLVAVRALAPRVAAVACLLLAFDGMFFVFARTAMPHMLLTAAIAGGALFLRRAITRPSARDATLAGACFGLATAVRWTGAPIALALVIAAWVSVQGQASAFGRRVGVLAGAGLAVYLASFTPYLAHGHGLADLVRLHRQMMWFHTHVPATFAQSTPAWSWPLAWRPVFLASGADGARRWVVVALGDHLLWWSMVPALGWLLLRARSRAAIDLLPLAAIAGTWLPWAMLGRFGMAYYLLPAAPFLAITVARLLALAPRPLRVGFVVAALAVFAVSYPVIAAVPLSPPLAARYEATLYPHPAPR